MNLYKQFGTNKSLEKEGIYIDYGKNSNGSPIRIRIARAGGANVRFQKVLEAKSKPYRRQIQNDTADAEVVDQLMKEVYAETIILGWEGVDDAEGNEIPFTKENCVRLFNDLPDLWSDIAEVSRKTAAFRNEILEDDLKN